MNNVEDFVEGDEFRDSIEEGQLVATFFTDAEYPGMVYYGEITSIGGIEGRIVWIDSERPIAANEDNDIVDIYSGEKISVLVEDRW